MDEELDEERSENEEGPLERSTAIAHVERKSAETAARRS
jgi:hypothetical protein